MMTQTVTIKQATALAKKKHGPNAHIEQNVKAPAAAEKAALSERWFTLKKRKEVLTETIRAAGDVNKATREAARFAVDVDGDEPSWTQLRLAVERAEQVAAALEERCEIDKEMELNSRRRLWNRYKVVRVDNFGGLAIGCIEASADTLEELAAKLA